MSAQWSASSGILPQARPWARFRLNARSQVPRTPAGAPGPQGAGAEQGRPAGGELGGRACGFHAGVGRAGPSGAWTVWAAPAEAEVLAVMDGVSVSVSEKPCGELPGSGSAQLSHRCSRSACWEPARPPSARGLRWQRGAQRPGKGCLLVKVVSSALGVSLRCKSLRTIRAFLVSFVPRSSVAIDGDEDPALLQITIISPPVGRLDTFPGLGFRLEASESPFWESPSDRDR